MKKASDMQNLTPPCTEVAKMPSWKGKKKKDKKINIGTSPSKRIFQLLRDPLHQFKASQPEQ